MLSTRLPDTLSFMQNYVRWLHLSHAKPSISKDVDALGPLTVDHKLAEWHPL